MTQVTPDDHFSRFAENSGMLSSTGRLPSSVGAVGVLVESNSPTFRRVAKFSAISSSSSIRIPKSLSKNATSRIRPSESICRGSSGSVIGGKEPRLLSMYSLSFGGISISQMSVGAQSLQNCNRQDKLNQRRILANRFLRKNYP